MMMSGMGLFHLWALLLILLALGFSYIIWIRALKETGFIKTTGQVIACGIAILTVILFLYGAIQCGQVKRGMKSGLMGSGTVCPTMGSQVKIDEMKMGKGMKLMHKMMGKGEQR